MALDSTSDEELLSRTNTLVLEYAQIAPALAKQLEAFGRLRKELQVLVTEINKRGLPFNDAPEV